MYGVMPLVNVSHSNNALVVEKNKNPRELGSRLDPSF
jgi:hypothetical protein